MRWTEKTWNNNKIKFMQEFFKQREKKSNNIMFHVLHGKEKNCYVEKLVPTLKVVLAKH